MKEPSFSCCYHVHLSFFLVRCALQWVLCSGPAQPVSHELRLFYIDSTFSIMLAKFLRLFATCYYSRYL